MTESLLQNLAVDFFGEEEEEESLLQVEMGRSLPLSLAADFFGKEEEGQLLQVETGELM